MRIAQFVHRYPPALGGSEAYFARLSQWLTRQGETVRVYTTNALALEAFWDPAAKVTAAGTSTEDGVEVRRYPLRHPLGRRYWSRLLSLLPLPRVQAWTLPCNPIAPDMRRAAERERDIDLVHATAFPYLYPILCGLELARRNRVPFVLTPFLHLGDPRDPHDRTRRAYLAPPMRYLLRQADAIFVQTEMERSAVADLGVPCERLNLLGMGVDATECTGGDRRRGRIRWQLDQDEIVIGHLANKSVEKGTVDLLRAAEIAWQHGATFRLLLAGPEMPNFRSYWEQFSLRERVALAGPLTEDEKKDFFATIDVFALPSRSDSFGIVFLEAWANGVPCIGYRAGGVAEVIQHGNTGLLVDCGDIVGLANALQRLAADAPLRTRFGQAGQTHVTTHCQWPPKLQLVHDVYRRLIRR